MSENKRGKTIIILQGIEHSGKRTTLKLLQEILLENNYNPLTSRCCALGDFIEVIEKDGIVVGITTAEENLQKLANLNCYIIFCSFRSLYTGLEATIEIEGYRNEVVLKTFSSVSKLQPRVNHGDAINLFTLMQELIRE